MPREDIFNEYAKIAIENGIVKVAKEDVVKPSKTRLDYSGSEAIQALYGIKPDKSSGVEYEKNISEYAHPNSVVVSPAHDKINGLVENINERQNIILNVIQDPTNGHLNQRKYAQSELMSSLIRIANDMDNKDEEELRVLADACIEDIRKVSFKVSDLINVDWLKGTVKDVGSGTLTGGLIGAVVLGLGAAFLGASGGGAVAALGALTSGAWAGAKLGAITGTLVSAIGTSGPRAQNVRLNADKTINQLDDLIKKFPENQFLLSFNKVLNILKNNSTRYSALISSQSPSQQEVESITRKYVKTMVLTKKYIAKFKAFKDSGEFETSHIWDGFDTALHNFVSDDTKEVWDCLYVLDSEMVKALESMATLKLALKNAAEEAKELAELEEDDKVNPINPSGEGASGDAAAPSNKSAPANQPAQPSSQQPMVQAPKQPTPQEDWG